MAELLPADERLATLARFIRNQVGLADRPPPGCIQLNNDEALLCAQALERSVETKAPRTYVAVVEPHHDRMKIGDRVVMIERIYAALGMDLPVCPHGLRYVENTCGPCSQGRPNRTPEHPETTVQPDEKCGNCGDDYSKHLGERLICPDAAMPDIYRWTAEPTQVKAGG
jgi:hypothetical protein